LTIDNGMIAQSLLAGHPVPCGTPSTGAVSADADPAAFLQALLQQLQGAKPPLPEGGGATGQGTESPIAGNPEDPAGKLLPDADELIDQLEQQGLTPEQLAQLMAQFAALPQAGAVPEGVGADPVGTTEAAVTDLPALEAADASASPVDGETATAVAPGLESRPAVPVMAAARNGAGRPSGREVTSLSLPLSAAPIDTPESPIDGPAFSRALEKAHGETEPAFSGAHSASTDGTSIPELPGMPRHPAPELAKAPALAMDRPVGHPGWSQDLSERVLWMTGRGLQAAELRLDPAHLGPLEVRIDMNRDQASIQFVSHHAAVREAIESAIPKLREMLGAQQLNLAEVSVSQHSFAEQRHEGNPQFAFDRQSRPQGEGLGGPLFEGTSTSPESEPTVTRTGRGLLNLYA
jgi:flagellar hook-length control protein FliK